MKRSKIFVQNGKNTHSIGIIGGKDGPTALFVSGHNLPSGEPALKFVTAVAGIVALSAGILFGLKGKK